MNYRQTLNFLYAQLPMFHRIGKPAYKANLDNITSLCKLLGIPQDNFKSVHVGGTNGKGSTSHMIASILQESGYNTGLFTSPHLKDFRERIRVNGKMISKREVVSFVNKLQSQLETIRPSFFEMTTAMAFDFFSWKKVDIAVIEVGLGGRLDSTNIIKPLLSVITNISLDHTQILGETIELIAVEKAGIIKQYTPIVIGETQQKTVKIFQKIAEKKNAEIFFSDKNGGHTEYKTELKGNYQLKNVKTVLQSIKVLKNMGFKIKDNHIRKGLLKVTENTGLMGRWQTLSKSPLIICDVAHNIDGIKEVVQQINETPHKKLHFVLGMVSDKNHNQILAVLPKDATYYFSKPDIPRGFDAVHLKEKARQFLLRGKVYKSVRQALRSAKKNAGSNDLIFVGGSNFVVAEVL